MGQSPIAAAPQKPCKPYSPFVCDRALQNRCPRQAGFKSALPDGDEMKSDEAISHPYETEGIYSVS